MIFGIDSLYSQTLIEGLWYLDKKPVSIAIKEGKIVSIQHIQRLTDEKNPIIIAPGLIDNQVNGFDGISFYFARGELTKEEIAVF